MMMMEGRALLQTCIGKQLRSQERKNYKVMQTSYVVFAVVNPVGVLNLKAKTQNNCPSSGATYFIH